jgi:hypothetical protein
MKLKSLPLLSQKRKEELYKLKVNYDLLNVKLNMVWDELKLHKPKNIQPSEKKRFAGVVFGYNKNRDKYFTGLYFG